MSEKIRINKYIASAGLVSRRGADDLIKQGKVSVNGEVVTEPGFQVTNRDKVIVNGKRVQTENIKYFAFYKPAGYITTKTDPKGRKTIYDILPEEMKKLNTAGRLDRASTGLIILTNDGELIQKLTHPKIHVSKVYRVVVEGRVTEQEIDTLANGIEIEEGKIAYAEAFVLGYEKKETILQVTLYQGYNRQIRRMMDFIGHSVVSLKRVTHGTIDIAGLDKGQYRKLLPREIYNLNKYLDKKIKKASRKESK